MENSFFRSPWYSPNPNPNPIRHGQFPFPQERPNRSPNPIPNLHGQSSKPKVVSVPVHFVESVAESKRKASAAVKIQKVFRGFLVRKNFKMVRKIEREIDEIEKRIGRDADLILRERKERIRINEMLMAVLFRLDSVRGVRDYRKKMIQRAISLQEALDSFSAERSEVIDRETLGNQDQEPKDQKTLEDSLSKAEEEIEMASAEEETMEDQETLENPQSEAEEEIKMASSEEEAMKDQEALDVPQSKADEEVKIAYPEEEAMEDQETLETSESKTKEVKKGTFSEESMVVQEETLEVPEPKPEEQSRTVEEETMDDQETIVKDIGVDEKVTPMEEEEDGWSIVETPETAMESGAAEAPEPEKVEFAAKAADLEKVEQRQEKLEVDSGGLKEVMERMAAENKQLKELVAVLCERSARQCSLMGGLAKRVEHLEKTVQTMERRKKKKREANTGLASENSKCCQKKSGE